MTLSSRFELMTPSQVASATGVPTQTLWAWRRHKVGLPFIQTGPSVSIHVLYDRRDVDAFIAKSEEDPSIVPVIPKKGYVRDTRTPEERKVDRARRKLERYELLASVWKEMGYSDEEIQRRLRR